MFIHEATLPGACGPPAEDSASTRGLSLFQLVLVAALAAGLVAAIRYRPEAAGAGLVVLAGVCFVANAAWRVTLVCFSLRRPPAPSPPAVWPRYTVLAALHDEAEVVDQLVRRLSAIDYPADRLQGFLALEADDAATLEAARAAPLPGWLTVLVVPDGTPRTKPRALNHALAAATGELLTVYDAEDHPDPLQLREAAARFAADPSGRLACLQAPLRIRRRIGDTASPFLDRQFAAEYASLFETALPGLARLGLPFPLGGTSNHFRVDVLRAVGGWDAWNVTEDADLGFRLWRRGYRSGVISRPTWETPPGSLETWLPQRTRWLKGYMQTWGVHTRRPWRLGVRGLFALTMTLGTGLASAALHWAATTWIAAAVLVAAVSGLRPETPASALAVMALGVAAAWLSCAIGARRAGVRYGPVEMLAAPVYWSLLSLAFLHAFWRLLREPFAWDKTRHRRDGPMAFEPARHAALDEAGSHRLSADHAAAPEPVA